MSWFEPSAFASLAKNAIKEAQKTIDKALDIRDDEENLPVIKDTKSQSIKKALKEETESFFKAFEKPEKSGELLANAKADQQKDAKLCPIEPTIDSPVEPTIASPVEPTIASHVEPTVGADKNVNDGKSRIVGSIWGSFTESFFENTLANAKELVSSKATSGPVPANQVVATQPPRNVSSLSDAQPQSNPHISDDSSNSSSITLLSGDYPSPLSSDKLPSTYFDRDVKTNCLELAAQRDGGWEWGLDSSIALMSPDENIDYNIPKIDTSSSEEGLVDDISDVDGFAHSRLIVGSVDSESSLLQHESHCSINSINFQNEIEYLHCVSEEVFYDHSTNIPVNNDSTASSVIPPDTGSGYHSSCSNTSSSIQQIFTSNSDSSLDYTDSILVLNSSCPLSPLDSDKSFPAIEVLSIDFQFPQRSSMPSSSISSPDSIEPVISSRNLNSPSSNSIEVLTSASSDCLSPTIQDSHSFSITDKILSTESDTLVDLNSVELQSSEESSTAPLKNLIEEPVKGDCDSKWGVIQEDLEGFTITKQPISAILHQKSKLGKEMEDNYEVVEDIHGHTTSFTSEEGSTSESMHSTSTSSTHTVLDANICSSQEIQVMNLSEISDQWEGSSIKPGHVEEGNERFENFSTIVSLSDEAHSHKGLQHISDYKEKLVDTCLKVENDQSFKEVSIDEDNKISKVENKDSTGSQVSNIGEHFRANSASDSVGTGFIKDICNPIQLELSTDSQLRTRNERTTTDIKIETYEKFGEINYDDYRSELRSSKDEKELTGEGDVTLPERELSPSSSDRSDFLKIGSSGHSSGDEVETATSSDIEVISSPSIDGSNGNSSQSFAVPSGTSPKVWSSTQKSLRSLINEKVEAHAALMNYRKDNGEKSETIPSSMTTSFTSISESDGDCQHLSHSELLQLEASRITQVMLQDINLYEKGHSRNQSAVSETSESSSELHTPEVDKLWKKINQLTDILEARETKVLELSHANSALHENNVTLKSRVDELEKWKIGSDASEFMREEFTQRLVTMERKFQQALREKELAKKQLEECITEAATRRSNADVSKELGEKDSIILELRQEGEKLSKQQLNYSNIIKKLRTKEKECETCIKDQKDKLESQANELERLRKQLNAKEDVERCQIDAIRQLTVVNQRQETEIKDLTAENAEVEGKLVALKEALDSAYREMTEMQRIAATKEAEVQENTLSSEVAAREKVEAALTDAKRKNKREQETLLAQIHELQDTLKLAENQANRKERQMRSEISELQQRLSESESRAEDLSNSMSSATRSLLRQTENLQTGHAVQQATWDSLEESLNKRINELQHAVTLSVKKEREAKEQCSSLHATMSSLQFQVTSLTAENSKLMSKCETITTRVSELEKESAKDTCQAEALKRSFSEEITEVKRERDILEQQLEIEKLAVSAEKKKAISLQELLKEKDRKLSQIQLSVAAGESRISTPRSSPTPSLSRLSISGSVNESLTGSHWTDEVFDPAWTSARGSSVYDTLRGSSAVTVDVLTSMLRQREGELHHVQIELAQLESQKESLSQELAQTSRKVDELSTKLIDYDKIKEMYLDMEQKYNALLQMYGEKVEEVEELRLDLLDVKEMYKLQIDQLMQR